jgi:hypothetical protein
MDYLYNTSRTNRLPQTQGVLGINRGIEIDSITWPVVGYKGGSEPGVLNMTYFLQRKDGRRFALSASWMRTDNDVDLEVFSAFLGGAVRVLSSFE